MPTQPTPVIDPGVDERLDVDKPWQVVVWNDPVNTMTYVVYVFRKLFGYDEVKART
jgi:ATP-dependent Clp protease adaptor protein ClpS